MQSFVYCLADPVTMETRYIGKTSCGMKRPYDHRRPWCLKRDRTHKGNWIRQLQAAGLSYLVGVLEEVPKEKLAECERKWISQAREWGWPLTNLTDGGEGLHGHRFSEEHKAKISAANKGRKLSPETKANIAAAAKGRPPVSEETVERRRVARMGYRHSDETKAKIGAAHRGKVVSEESRTKESATKRRKSSLMEASQVL